MSKNKMLKLLNRENHETLSWVITELNDDFDLFKKTHDSDLQDALKFKISEFLKQKNIEYGGLLSSVMVYYFSPGYPENAVNEVFDELQYGKCHFWEELGKYITSLDEVVKRGFVDG